MLNEINGEKLRAIRGSRSLMDVAKASNGKFSDVALMKWEKGDMKPKHDKIPALLQALECNLDDITAPVELAIAI